LFGGSYLAIGNYVAPLSDFRPPIQKQCALGKGQTKQQAIASCIGEALERYSLIYTGAEPVRRARFGELPILDPREILLVSERQYQGRESWNATHPDRYWIPEPFDESRELDVLPALDLISGGTVYVPAASCLMWYPFQPGERPFSSADSVGCGAGRTLASATLSALLEWVERDAMAIWWYNRLRRPGVLIESFESDALIGIRDSLREAGRELYLLDVTTDFGIPVYVAVSPAKDGKEPVFGTAASLSPREAAVKAASEAAQIIFSAVHLGVIDQELHSWLNTATLETQTYLLPAGYVAAPREPEPASIERQLEYCARRLNERGINPVAVDQSSPDVILKTVRVVAPGLRHIWARFAPGRLYDVPVQMGWMPEPLDESNLNSILCMI
jgi:ribosomal protein S12 methylthiotransferase accessory factor